MQTTRYERMLHSGESSEHAFEDWPAVGMIQGVRLRCLRTEIRNFQDSQDCGILADAAVMNLTGQPLPDRFIASPARGNLTARCGQGVYGLRRRRSLDWPAGVTGSGQGMSYEQTFARVRWMLFPQASTMGVQVGTGCGTVTAVVYCTRLADFA